MNTPTGVLLLAVGIGCPFAMLMFGVQGDKIFSRYGEVTVVNQLEVRDLNGRLRARIGPASYDEDATEMELLNAQGTCRLVLVADRAGSNIALEDQDKNMRAWLVVGKQSASLYLFPPGATESHVQLNNVLLESTDEQGKLILFSNDGIGSERVQTVRLPDRRGGKATDGR